MTKEEKKERRVLRHKLQHVASKRGLTIYARLRMSPNQIKAAGKVLAERILSGQDPTTVVPIA